MARTDSLYRTLTVQAHLKRFQGMLQADGYAGFDGLYAEGHILEVGCWAHVRRKFYDFHLNTQSPVAAEALRRIGELYAIEDEIRGRLPEARASVRSACAGPLLDDLKAWLEAQLARVSKKWHRVQLVH